MMRTLFRLTLAATLTAIAVASLASAQVGDEIFADDFEQGDAAPWSDGPVTEVNVFYSGHSLVNLDLPRMLDQIALDLGLDHRYNLQMGIGSNMQWRLTTPEDGQNRDGNAPLGFSILTEIPDAQTIAGEKYDTLVVTEAVPVFDHLLWSESIANTRQFYDLILASPSAERLELYEVWPAVEGGDFTAWRAQVATDRVIWDCIASRVNSDPRSGRHPVLVLPGGEALAELVAAVENGSVAGIASADELFADDIHLSNLGNYFMALVHTAMLYRTPPTEAPTVITDPWGTEYPGLPSTATAEALAGLAWEVVDRHLGRPEPRLDTGTCFELIRPRCDGNAYCEDRLLNEVLTQ